MCDGFSAVMGAISAVSAVAGTVAAQTQAEAQHKQAQAMAAADERNAWLAIQEMQDAANKEGIQQQQERVSIANEKLQRKKSTMQGVSTFLAGTEAEGATLDDVTNEYWRIYGENSNVLDQQLNMLDMGHIAARKTYEAQAKGRIEGMSDIYIQPLGLTTGLNITSGVLGAGSGVLGAVNEYKDRTKGHYKGTLNVSAPEKLSYGKKSVWDTSRYKLKF